jgi:two-component system, NtrC family, response regulator AtoC
MTSSVLDVLIIEDEPILGKNICAYLVRYGYEVRLTTTAEAGLSELEAFKPDVIVLDFNLPGMNGLEALSKIRAIDCQIKVLMMTAYGGTDLAVKAMRAGASDFVTKPISIANLRLKLEDIVIDARRDQGCS